MFSKKIFSSSYSGSSAPTTTVPTSTSTDDPSHHAKDKDAAHTPTPTLGGPSFHATSKDEVPIHAYPKLAPREGVPNAGDSVITLSSDNVVNRVREYRNIKVVGGKALVKDLPLTLDPTSVRFQSLTDPDARVTKQIFHKQGEGAETAPKLLAKNIGQLVTITNNSQKLTPITGILKAVTNDSILLMATDDKGKSSEASGDTIDSGVWCIPLSPTNTYTFPNLTATIFSSNLDWRINTKVEEHLVDISYACSGMKWGVNYIGLLDSAYTSLHLTGWYSLENQSGVAFNSAKVIFVDSTRESFHADYSSSPRRKERSNSYEKVSSFNIGSYSKSGPKIPRKAKITTRFQLPSNIEIPNGESILEKAVDVVVPIKLFHLVYPRDIKFEGKLDTEDRSVNENFPVSQVITFLNDKEHGLGICTPGGDLALSIVQEGDAIVEVRKVPSYRLNEQLSVITLATLDHVTVGRKKTDFNYDSRKKTMRESFDITIGQNTGNDVFNLVVEENIYRWSEWEVTGSATVSTPLIKSAPYTEVTCEKHELKNNRVVFRIPSILKDNVINISYTVVYLNF